MKLIGFVGMPGSGKSAASDVARCMGLEVVVMGDIIRQEARRLGLAPTDENLGMVGNVIRVKEGPNAIAKRTLEQARISRKDLVVIDGIRSGDEVDFFRANSDYFCLVEVFASTEVRLRRLSLRGRSDDAVLNNEISPDANEVKIVSFCSESLGRTAELLEKRECRELGWGMHEAFKESDLRLNNDGDLDEFKGKVKSILKKIGN